MVPQFLLKSGPVNKLSGSLATECVLGPVNCLGIADTGSDITVIQSGMLKGQGIAKLNHLNCLK